MSTHHLHIHADNCQTAKVLQKLHGQMDEFCKTMEALPVEQETELLKSIILDNEMILVEDKRVPYVYTPSYDIRVLSTLQRPCIEMFIIIMMRLAELDVIREYWYTTKDAHAIIWTKDVHLISKNMRPKLKRYFERAFGWH